MNHNSQPVIFVTGGSRGIGKSIVEKFQSEGWLVAACSVTSNVDSSSAELKLICDVSDKSSVKASIEKILQKFGRLDAVINNAGIPGPNSLHSDDDDMLWHQIVDINLHGTYYTSKYALPHLPDHTGRIVNISSVLGLKGVAEQTAYCAAKHGVLGFTKALAQHLAKRHITVNAICPGWVRTDLMQNKMIEMNATEDDLVSSVPMGRVIEPKEVADIAWYLVSSDAAKNMTGQSIVLDGGFLA